MSVGTNERLTLIVREPEPGCLERGNEINLPRPGADRVPVGEHDPLPVAEQVPPVSVTVDHPGREPKAELPIRSHQPITPLSQPASFLLTDCMARSDRP